MKTRKGFTLVELLIVIAILGTLTAMMTLSSSTSTDSAEAAKIVNALRTARTAAIMFYWDHPDLQTQPAASWDLDSIGATKVFAAEVGNYLEATPDGNDATSRYSLKLTGSGTGATAVWYVGYDLSGNTAKFTSSVKKRLAGQASAYGLKKIDNTTVSAFDGEDATTTIYMRVRGTEASS